MKKFFVLTAIFILFSAASSFSQWENIYSNNTWANGSKIFSHNSVIFQTGYGGNANHILKSTDNGATWTEISSLFPYTVYYVQSFGNEIFAVTTVLGSTAYLFYVSTDNGGSWSERSRIDTVTGNGAILSMASDGSTLFAVSNRSSIYKSTDNGTTWQEIIVNYSAAPIAQFTALGNKYLAVLTGVGCIVSSDGGQTWAANNNPSPISALYKANNLIFGSAGFTGIYKYDAASNSWGSLYSPGAFTSLNSLAGNGSKLISTFGDFFGNRKYYFSENDGTSWIELTTDTIGLGNQINSFSALTANSSYYFASYWKSNSGIITAAAYRLPIQPTDVQEISNGLRSFNLYQNFPNPFNPSTKISWQSPSSGRQVLTVFNILGNEAVTLVDEYKPAGRYEIEFKANEFTSGVYFYKLQIGNFVQVKKMMLVR